MCGRYALSLRLAQILNRIRNNGMPADETPDDDEIRQTYNFAPGYYGLVYRADVPDYGAGHRDEQGGDDAAAEEREDGQEEEEVDEEDTHVSARPRYKLQAMKWGLVPFWTKRNPDYGTLMRTINCRDDSLSQRGGMWQTMKSRKRCIVIAEGFYEWLKKNNGKDRLPHYVKRKDGQLMCMAGLWDCVKFEDSQDKLYTYSIITTDCNKQISFLHDRMPVILENGSKEMFTWLDSAKGEWDSELQSLLNPYNGELEIYQVPKEVGKVGNNSETFIVPIDSADNKNNIANFFGQQKKGSPAKSSKEESLAWRNESSHDALPEPKEEASIKDEVESGDVENNAPNPASSLKRARSQSSSEVGAEKSPAKAQRTDSPMSSPTKVKSANRQMHSATRNTAKSKSSPVKSANSNAKITSFFTK